MKKKLSNLVRRGAKPLDLRGRKGLEKHLTLLSQSIASHYCVFPLGLTRSDRLKLAASPSNAVFTNTNSVDDLSFMLQTPLLFIPAVEGQVEELVGKHYGTSPAGVDVGSPFEMDAVDRMLDDITDEASGNNVDVVLLKRPATVAYLAVSPQGELQDIRLLAEGREADAAMVLGQVFPDAELTGLPVNGHSAFAFLKAATGRETFDKQTTADLISKLIPFVAAAAR